MEARIDKEGDAPDYRPLPAHLDLCCPGCKHTQRMVRPNPKNGGKWITFWCTSCSTPWPANKWTCSCNRLWAACAAHFRWDGQSTKRKRVDVTTKANASRMFGEIAPELRRRRATIVTTIGQVAPIVTTIGQGTSKRRQVTIIGQVAPIVKTIGRNTTEEAQLCEPDGGTFSTPARLCEPEGGAFSLTSQAVVTSAVQCHSRSQVEPNRGITRPPVHRKRRKKCW